MAASRTLPQVRWARIDAAKAAVADWLPVVWMQIRMRDLARTAVRTGQPLPPAYFHLFRVWFAFGFPAFAAVLGILWLMVTQPAL
ncbi:DUF2269 family protein [Nitrospirillum sp. BR 11163]|uniref:DUF2269 family protein n=1 Tax=Nitrospirillum sp. BR 11163 TaxID=3104323 RepID=UPI002AFF2881|nr:DUF2269 family protein [Nitrospirillum sp. BR 11163]MEA1677551.1 DUF2269 family protein [Nitrospirillum sp. BR 11163]